MWPDLKDQLFRWSSSVDEGREKAKVVRELVNQAQRAGECCWLYRLLLLDLRRDVLC